MLTAPTLSSTTFFYDCTTLDDDFFGLSYFDDVPAETWTFLGGQVEAETS